MDKLVTTARERFWNAEAYARDQWVKAQADRLPPRSRVLDAGAGASKYRPCFSHCQYETQDFCQYEGELVKYREKVNYVCDITAIPLAGGCLDAILCTEVLEHVVNPMAVVEEFSRLLKPGGKLFLTAPLLSYLHMEPYHFYGGFTHHWYRHWLPQYGFCVESITPIGGPGRTCVTFCHAFYGRWAALEGKLNGFRRLISRVARWSLKIPIHYGLGRILPKFDPWLGGPEVCSGYMVVASRQVKTEGPTAGALTMAQAGRLESK